MLTVHARPPFGCAGCNPQDVLDEAVRMLSWEGRERFYHSTQQCRGDLAPLSAATPTPLPPSHKHHHQSPPQDLLEEARQQYSHFLAAKKQVRLADGLPALCLPSTRTRFIQR